MKYQPPVNFASVITSIEMRKLDNAKIYFGKAHQDPRIAPVSVFLDSALTLYAPPFLKVKNGYIWHEGSIVNIYANESVSVLLLDVYGRQLLYVNELSYTCGGNDIVIKTPEGKDIIINPVPLVDEYILSNQDKYYYIDMTRFFANKDVTLEEWQNFVKNGIDIENKQMINDKEQILPFLHATSIQEIFNKTIEMYSQPLQEVFLSVNYDNNDTKYIGIGFIIQFQLDGQTNGFETFTNVKTKSVEGEPLQNYDARTRADIDNEYVYNSNGKKIKLSDVFEKEIRYYDGIYGDYDIYNNHAQQNKVIKYKIQDEIINPSIQEMKNSNIQITVMPVAVYESYYSPHGDVIGDVDIIVCHMGGITTHNGIWSTNMVDIVPVLDYNLPAYFHIFSVQLSRVYDDPEQAIDFYPFSYN